MKEALIILGVYFTLMGSLHLAVEKEKDCKKMIETLKQTIQVKEISNQTLREMVRKRDSIIYVQDSVIIMLKNNIK